MKRTIDEVASFLVLVPHTASPKVDENNKRAIHDIRCQGRSDR